MLPELLHHCFVPFLLCTPAHSDPSPHWNPDHSVSGCVLTASHPFPAGTAAPAPRWSSDLPDLQRRHSKHNQPLQVYPRMNRPVRRMWRSKEDLTAVGMRQNAAGMGCCFGCLAKAEHKPHFTKTAYHCGSETLTCGHQWRGAQCVPSVKQQQSRFVLTVTWSGSEAWSNKYIILLNQSKYKPTLPAPINRRNFCFLSSLPKSAEAHCVLPSCKGKTLVSQRGLTHHHQEPDSW